VALLLINASLWYSYTVPQTLDASCRDRLKTAVEKAIRVYAQLEVAVSAWPSRGNGGIFTPPGPRPPWSSAAANLIFELRHEVRYMEASLRTAAGLPVRERGGSDVNTLTALRTITNIAEAAGVARANDAARWLERWDGAAARALGEASSIIRLPRQPGEKERPCPFCVCLTLRYWPLLGVVRCINSTCKDDSGKRPSARIEYSDFTTQLELVWMDGGMGLPSLPEKKASEKTEK
jgi:hypothetical protein